MLIQVSFSIDLRWRDSEVLKGRLLAVEARAAHDRLGLTHTGMLREARTIRKVIRPAVTSSVVQALGRLYARNDGCRPNSGVPTGASLNMIVANSVY
jgi:hypothetical protein